MKLQNRKIKNLTTDLTNHTDEDGMDRGKFRYIEQKVSVVGVVRGNFFCSTLPFSV
jgi:hypothetical protein